MLQRLSFLPGPPIVAVLAHLEVSRVLALEVARKAVELDGGRHPVGDGELGKPLDFSYSLHKDGDTLRHI